MRLAGRDGVALRKESVDRNQPTEAELAAAGVALRKESVDRNCERLADGGDDEVALRKESVDRNAGQLLGVQLDDVALRKESVDRNLPLDFAVVSWLSLSARRAWIEIVASKHSILMIWCRSPQGERG